MLLARITCYLLSLILSISKAQQEEAAPTTSRTFFTPMNPLSMLLNLPVRQNQAPISVMNIQLKTAFRSGGNEMQIVLLNPAGGSTSPFNTTSLLLHYFDEANTSPTAADSILTQPCRNSVSFIYCPFPDISDLYPDYTADRYNVTTGVEPVGDFNGCKFAGRSRLCYTIKGDNQQIGFVNAGSSQFFPSEALSFLRLSQTLMYYPDPVVYNITLQSQKRLKITGKGLNGDNAPFAKFFSFYLSDNRVKCVFTPTSVPNTDEATPMDANMTAASNRTTKPPPTTTELPRSTSTSLYCDFDNARLVDMLEDTYGKAYLMQQQDINVDFVIRNGNWLYNTTINYPLGNTPPPAPPIPTHHYNGPSTEVIVAIVVPVCFISVVIACACVALCSMRYGTSPVMMKAAKRMENACPGPWRKWMATPQHELDKTEPDDITQLLRLLPPDMAETIKQHQIDSNRVVQGDELGTGYFGIVRSGKLMSPKDANGSGSSSGDSIKGRAELVALKFIQRYTDIDQLKEFFQEAIYMLSFDHEHVLSAHGVTSISSFPAVVLPLMDAGDLQKFVRSASNQVTDPLLVDFAIQIAKGMQYLAEKKIVHRDLAARNCLLTKQRIVKVADFGLSRKCDEINQYYEVPNYQIKTHGRPLPIRWMAPECLEYGTFSEKTDVWSYGVVLWELTTRGARPYPAIEPSYLKRHLCDEKQRLPKLPIISDCLYELMTACWDEHSSARPTFTELMVLTETLLNDPESALWMNVSNQLRYHDPEQLDQQLNQIFEDSLLAASAESTVDGTATTHCDDSTCGTSSNEDQRKRGQINSEPSELINTPSDISQFSAGVDSGVTSSTSPDLRRHSPAEMTLSSYSALAKTPIIAQYDRVNYSREDSCPVMEKTKERGSGDVDSVFIATSRPGTPTPPDSAVSGMSFASTPGFAGRNSWCSRSFTGANPVRSTPSTDSAASTSSSTNNAYSPAALTSSIRRTRHNNNKMMIMATHHHLLTPIGTLGDDDSSLSSPPPSCVSYNNKHDANNNINIIIDR